MPDLQRGEKDNESIEYIHTCKDPEVVEEVTFPEPVGLDQVVNKCQKEEEMGADGPPDLLADDALTGSLEGIILFFPLLQQEDGDEEMYKRNHQVSKS